MAAPSKTWTDIADARVDIDSPLNTDLFTFLRDNIVHTDERVGVPVAPANRQANHRHRGLDNDGSDFIELSPQENLIAGSDGVVGFTETLLITGPGKIAFTDETPLLTPRRIIRADTSIFVSGIRKALISPVNKIKSSGGKGRFTCSIHIKRVAAASGVVGGTLRFGLHSGAAWITGAFVDIDFDDVTEEYKRFYFVSNQIARPAALNLRAQWMAEPSDWDTISNGDLVGHIGGLMVNNGAGIAKWDISHLDGGADDYLASPTDDITYWWDENITTVQKTP